MDEGTINTDEEETPVENKGKLWNYKTTTLLIKQYDRYKNEFFEPKVKKVHIWNKISKHFQANGYNYSGDLIDNKWRNMKKTYRVCLLNLGEQPIRWPYFEMLHEIFTNPPYTEEFSGQSPDMSKVKYKSDIDDSNLYQTFDEDSEIEEVEVPGDLSQFLMFEDPSGQQNESIGSKTDKLLKRKASNSQEPSSAKRKTPRLIKPKQKQTVSVENGRLVFNILEMEKSDQDTSSEDGETDETAPIWFKRFVERHRKDEKRRMKMFNDMHNDIVELEREKLNVLKTLIERLPEAKN